jgi:hypothetical protein
MLRFIEHHGHDVHEVLCECVLLSAACPHIPLFDHPGVTHAAPPGFYSCLMVAILTLLRQMLALMMCTALHPKLSVTGRLPAARLGAAEFTGSKEQLVYTELIYIYIYIYIYMYMGLRILDTIENK